MGAKGGRGHIGADAGEDTKKGRGRKGGWEPVIVRWERSPRSKKGETCQSGLWWRSNGIGTRATLLSDQSSAVLQGRLRRRDCPSVRTDGDSGTRSGRVAVLAGSACSCLDHGGVKGVAKAAPGVVVVEFCRMGG